MNKRLTISMIVIVMMVFSCGVMLRVGLPWYKEQIAYETLDVANGNVLRDDVIDESGIVEKYVEDDADTNDGADINKDADEKKDIIDDVTNEESADVEGYKPKVYRGETKASRGGGYSAMSETEGSNGEAIYTGNNGVVIKIMQGNSSRYLTNRSVLLDIHYPESVSKTLKIGGSDLGQLTDDPGEFNYVVRVRDNVVIEAGGEEFNIIKNIVKVETGCEIIEDRNNSANNRGYVKDKTYYSARLGGIIKSKDVELTKGNVSELGVRYWRSDNDDIYTVKYNKENMFGSGNDNFKVVKNDGGELRFEILARSLKESTTYYMQAYMINADNEVLLGDVKEFATRSQNEGLYGLYYDSTNSSDPIVIKQETVDTMKFTNLNRKKVRWVGEIIPLNNGVMKFRTTTDANTSGGIIISNGGTDIYKGYSSNDSTVDVLQFNPNGVVTKNIYTAGKKYKIIIEAYNDNCIENFKLEWMEDGQYQEVPKTQLCPKEYLKISSAVINSVGTDNQKIGSDGKLINKKIINNGKKMKSCTIEYNNDVASSVEIDGTKYEIIPESDIRHHRVGKNLSDLGNACTIEGWIVYNTNDVVEPIIENVSNIDYDNKWVTLRNGSQWKLYGKKGSDNPGVEIVGRVVVRKKDDNEVYEVYDLGRYIENGSALSDGENYNNTQVYKTVAEDDTHVVNLTKELGESDVYYKVLNQYSTMEHFVEDSKPVDKKWNLGIGEGRVFSLVPIRMLISFDGDEGFTMKDPVIKISKKLYGIKNGATAKDGENVLEHVKINDVEKEYEFKLAFPTDVGSNLKSLDYADWRYMNNNGQEGTDKHSVNMVDGDEYITITLEDFSTSEEAKDDGEHTNVMLNFVVRLDSVKEETSEEIFNSLYEDKLIINDSYKLFTEVKIDSLKTSSNDNVTVKVKRLPVEIKVKPQVTFE